MASATGSKHLPSADTAFLHMDRPTNLMVINFVMLFDEPLSLERLRRLVRTGLVARYPRFQMCVAKNSLGRPRFVPAPRFEPDDHIQARTPPALGDEEALRDRLSELVAAPLERSRPLWEMHLLERPGGGHALLVRVHHCMVDGIALARVIVALTDEAIAYELAQAAQVDERGARVGPRAASGEAEPTLRSAGRTAARASLGHGAAAARALGKLLFTPTDARTAFRGRLCGVKRVAWTEQIDLARVKETARAQGTTVNDVLLAAVSGALRRHLLEVGQAPRAIRTLVPINLRPLEQPLPRELGNRFGLVFLTLPVDVATPHERLRELTRRMTAIKHSPEGPVSYAVLKAIGLTPRWVEHRVVDMFTAKVSAMMTNVPGPPFPVHIAGCPLRAVQVWAPMSGSVGMSVSIFSYRGEVTIGLLTDTGLVSEPRGIVAYVECELTELTELGAAGGRAETSGGDTEASGDAGGERAESTTTK